MKIFPSSCYSFKLKTISKEASMEFIVTIIPFKSNWDHSLRERKRAPILHSDFYMRMIEEY